MSLKDKLKKFSPKYPQPYNIKLAFIENIALEFHLKQKSHHRQKYKAKYGASKRQKRIYD